jgi:hypothetical protein
MTQKNQQSEGLPPNPSPDFVAMTKTGFAKLSAVQSELIEEIRDANQIWLDRVRSEAAIASEFTSKLAASHSISDTSAAYQEWTKQHMELFAEDGKRVMAGSQKFMAKAAQLFANGWPKSGSANGGA